MEKKLLCLFLALLLTATGCGTGVQEKVEKQKSEIKEQVKEETYKIEQPVVFNGVSLELPVSMVRALVDRNGYQPDREKKVIFIGDNLTGSFRVIREADWEIVYTGTIQKLSTAGDSHENSISVGDFSAVTEPGTYYIEQNEVGRSYTFEIAEEVYDPIFAGLVQNLQEELPPAEQVSAEDICNVSFGMHSMMLALQFHGTLFEKDNNLVTQLLKMAEWLMTFQDKNGSMFEDYEATAAFCGVLAQSADAFGKYDANVSKEYRAASQKAWKWMERQTQGAKENPSAHFYAATQLFKVEGSRNYAVLIEKFLENRTKKMTEDKFVFYGAVTYLGTVKNTNRDLCTKIMKELVDETEEINRKEKENPYLVSSNDISQNLQKVLLICFVDYITPSNEYAVIIENTLHYLCGRNATGNIYIDETGKWQPKEAVSGRTLEWNGILLFCLSDLLDDAADDIK